MRITHLCLAGTITDGWSYQENILSKYHQKQGHEVSIITARWVFDEHTKLYKFPKEDYLLDDGVRVIRLEILFYDSFRNTFRVFKGVKKALIKTNPDILFIHGCQFCDIYTVVKYLKSHRNTIVYVDNHADFSNSAKSKISYWGHRYIWRFFAQLIQPYVKTFYGVLPARVEFLKNVYGISPSKVKLLVMGGDDEKVEIALKKRNELRKGFGIKDSDFLVVTGGKIDKWKTQTMLLMKAIQQMNNKNVFLYVFGSIDKDLKAEFDSLLDGRNIKYLGWVDSQLSYDYFASSDLVVFPGRHSVYWEQVAALGVPMVVKEWPGTQHVNVNGNVMFLKEDNVSEIKETINRIISDRHLYNTMKDRAQSVRNIFSYNEIAKRSIE